jgi:hypothetical protein
MLGVKKKLQMKNYRAVHRPRQFDYHQHSEIVFQSRTSAANSLKPSFKPKCHRKANNSSEELLLKCSPSKAELNVSACAISVNPDYNKNNDVEVET